MSNYDLDERTGFSLLNLFGSKNNIKMIKFGDTVDVKHFKMFEYLNASVIDNEENALKLRVKEFLNETFIFPDDHVIINYADEKELYVLSGTVTYVYTVNPLTLKVEINRVEKLKNLRKHQRFYVSLMSNIKVEGFITPIFAVVKNISPGGIKVNCTENLIPEDVLEVEVILDRTNKLVFKGAVVRKNRLRDYFEYGIEIQGMSEVNVKCLHHYLNWLDSSYK
ncbi:MAG: PilZ domain-containing protein [Clostridiaceae bacterium]|nr:PilZ domain-containing protein [Clostridiaceae bacterium]